MHFAPVAFATVLVLCTARAEIVINEIHYHPMERGPELEFIELVNTGPDTVDLSGWRFEEGIDYTFPDKVSIPAGALLVIAANPADLKHHYDVEAHGPWKGKLSNEGETLTLRDAGGRKTDEVDYGEGFPWPTMAAGGGASMELIHIGLDNDLSGSWRSSLKPEAAADREPRFLIQAQAEDWRYLKGLREPPGNWRHLDFDARRWRSGQTPIGYADGDDNTVLRDMQNNYTTVYLRKTFTYDPTNPLEGPLLLRVYSDDGAVIWLNDQEIGRLRVAGRNPTHRSRTTVNHEAAWEEILIRHPQRILKPGKNVLAIIAVNGNPTSSDFSIDAELRTPPPESIPPQPSPGAPNHAATPQPPPQIRQVRHEPRRPLPDQPVKVTCKVTDPDEVAEVTLLCQRVSPGDYIHREDPRYQSTWTTIPMKGEGDLYTAEVPPDWQQRRHLIRYRIAARDKRGATVRVPYADDAQPNFAYYCYDEAPAWAGIDRRGRPPVKIFSRETMNALPILHLIAASKDVENSQYRHAFNERFLRGTLVAGDEVYDHIRFRNRGETTTYSVGKNKWRINFNRTRELPANVLDGKPGKRRWKRLNLNPATAPYDASFRGNAALNERLVFRLYQLAGSPAPDTAHIHFRVVDDEDEAGADQYSGDLWGLYMAFESVDGFLLDNHGEPDGEIHRVKQSGNRLERPPAHPAPPGLSYGQFWADVRRRRQPAEWWRRTVDLERYFGYHAISIITVRYDQKLNHNHMLYRHPQRGWTVIPWDADLSFRTVRYDPHHHRWHPYLKDCLAHAPYWIAYQNRGRELLDLLFNDHQVNALVEELVRDLGPIERQMSFAEVDRYLWNNHPRTTRHHRETFYLPHLPPRRDGMEITFDNLNFAERVRYFKEFLTLPHPGTIRSGGKSYRGWGHLQLREDVKDPDIPATPSIRFVSQSALTFTCNAFADPQGATTFAGMRWRAGEIYDPSVPHYHPGDPNRYEVETVWQSPILQSIQEPMTIPQGSLLPGRTYRVRAQFLDDSGRWSHWSAPLEFTTAKPDVQPYRRGLVISEIMYHPRRAESGLPESEFVELTNLGQEPLDLTWLQFSDGIEFDFTDASVQILGPGQRIVIVEDRDAFLRRFPDRAEVVAGEWTSGKLANNGEWIRLKLGEGRPFVRFRYDDQDPWPEAADGAGHSLELKPSSKPEDLGVAASWAASQEIGGSPGR